MEKKARPIDPRIRKLLKEINELLESGEIQTANIRLHRLLRNHPNLTEASQLLHRCLSLLQDTEGIEYLLREAHLANERGEYQTAIIYWSKVLELSPEQDDVRYRIRKAQQLLERQIQINIAERKLRTAIKSMDTQSARDILRDLKELDPDNPNIYDFESSIVRVGLRIERFKHSVHEAENCMSRGDLDRAMLVWEMVLDQNPDYEPALQSLAAIQKELNDKEKEAWVNKWLNIAHHAFDNKSFRDAVVLAKRVLTLDAINPEGIKLLRDSRNALHKEQRIKKLLNHAHALVKNEEFEHAIDVFTTVLGLKGADQEIQAHIDYCKVRITRKLQET